MEAIKFESDLLNISLSAFYVDETNESNPQNFMTIDEMMKQWPTIEWLTYINSVFSMVSDTKKINKNETVIVNYPTFITNFEKFISSTPKRVLINYAFGRAIIDLLELTNLGSNTILENEDLEMKDENDWRNCVRQTADSLPEIVTALYVRNFIRDDEKLEAMNIASNIKNELIKAINEAKWLDVETRNNASHKVMSAKTNIGYPDFYRNDNEITEIFRDLQIGESTYLHNVWKIHRFNAALTLRGTGNKDEHFATWIPVLASTTSSTAFYYALENVIVVSPNRLQRPTIDKTQPSYMNYGRIGFVIGHELGHVFDTLRNSISKDKITKDLLIKTSAENLNKRVDCIMDQYNNYTFEDTNNIVNVRLPHRENIADNVGVKMIYYAYKDWSSLHDPEPTLPGLNYTSSQMFWISLASLRCTGRRTPNQYRIIGILSNIPEFSKDFNCPLAQQSNMCITPTCLQAAADIMENMDTSVNPCDNFFKFTCGQFLNSAFTRPDETTASWISDMYEEIVTRLSGLLNSKISENDIKLFRQTKQLYRQCLDRKTLTEQQDKNILDILNKFGGWPVVILGIQQP
ncbi:hypothetical protein PV328_011206 [Microctonus aethiopoides]|uniref:Uncharacterized protein n=1 Tax=Microctonus aethiopoides TaxID=144406 RepID=A0AA39C403_9HYME|nr:hypothetical protein PV328_011206 [Microctonus aethiopoides]